MEKTDERKTCRADIDMERYMRVIHELTSADPPVRHTGPMRSSAVITTVIDDWLRRVGLEARKREEA